MVKTAVDMGMTRADGKSLLKYDQDLGGSTGDSADNIPSFTLGSVYVSPMSMAAAYASVAARGWYCSPQAISEDPGDRVRPAAAGAAASVPPRHAAGRRRRGQLHPAGRAERAGHRGRPRHPGHFAAAKTGTANGGYYAAFAGYTPTLAGYVSVFNPINPTGAGAMLGSNSCYRDLSGENCPGQMFGDNAPGATWEYTFLRAALGPDVNFVNPPGYFFSLGNGLGAPKTIGAQEAEEGRRQRRRARRRPGGRRADRPTH